MLLHLKAGDLPLIMEPAYWRDAHDNPVRYIAQP